MSTIKISNGLDIPVIGFGTWQLTENVEAVIAEALKVGYRHIDTAAIYKNETEIGNALQHTDVDRSSIFLTSKVWNTDRGYDNTLAAFEKSLERLQTDYLDLYLIHWPANNKNHPDAKEINVATWRAMQTLYKSGKVKAIGLSNFLKHHVEDILETAEIKPMVNQLEFHPGYLQEDTVSFCKANNIVVQAWSPLGSGRLLDDSFLKEISARYNVSVATLCLQFALQEGLVVLPKSVNPKNIDSNLNFEKFKISDEDMRLIKGMSEKGFSGSHPDSLEF